MTNVWLVTLLIKKVDGTYECGAILLDAPKDASAIDVVESAKSFVTQDDAESFTWEADIVNDHTIQAIGRIAKERGLI